MSKVVRIPAVISPPLRNSTVEDWFFVHLFHFRDGQFPKWLDLRIGLIAPTAALAVLLRRMSLFSGSSLNPSGERSTFASQAFPSNKTASALDWSFGRLLSCKRCARPRTLVPLPYLQTSP